MLDSLGARIDALKERFAPRIVLAWLKRHWVTLWLVPQTIVSVALFFHGAGKIRSVTASSGVATIEGDSGLRRERGQFAFIAAFAGTPALDWEGLASTAGHPVLFSVASSHRYILESDSLVVFRAPFREDRNIEDRFRVLKGSVTTEDHRTVKNFTGGDQAREIPKVLKKPDMNALLAKVYPRLDSHLIVTKPGEASISFAWGREETGFIAVLAVENDRVQYFPIENVDHARAPVQTDHSYAWQVVSADRQILEGPFRFQIASGGDRAWQRVLTDPSLRKDKGGVDVLLDQ